MAILNFNAREVDPNSSFDPLPEGWYNVKMIESEIKPTKAGDGSYLSAQFEVLDGQFVGRRIFTNYNIENKNPVAVKIAYEQLSALCHCAGVLDLQDSTMLHGIPVQVKLKVKPATEQFDAGNEIKGYRNQHGQDPKDIIAGTGTSGTTAPTPPTPPAAPSAPPPPPAPAAPAHDPMAAAVADGWVAHPSAAGYHYKGEDVKADAEVAAMYPAPAAAPPAPPAAPPAPPAAPPAPADGATPPWIKPGA